MAIDRSCCDINQHVNASVECALPTGGAYDLRIACAKYVSFVEKDCDGNFSDGSPAGTANDALVNLITTADPVTAVAAPYFFNVATRDKTLEYIFSYNFDPDTGTLTRTETLNFDVEVKDRGFYCQLEIYIGQEVIALFKEKGTDRWYMAGRTGNLRITSISGGTGTTEFLPTSFVITNTGSDSIFIQVFDTDGPTTDALVDGVTAP